MGHQAECKKLSYQILKDAWEAAQKKNYNPLSNIREDLKKWVQKHFNNKVPHDWQLDVVESVLHGLDTLVVDPTGVGKSLPFIMLLAKWPKKKIIIISPLIALQLDMV